MTSLLIHCFNFHLAYSFIYYNILPIKMLVITLKFVQRRFSKRLVGSRNITNADRNNFLELDSLDERLLRFDACLLIKSC